jgi:hypothetical protein
MAKTVPSCLGPCIYVHGIPYTVQVHIVQGRPEKTKLTAKPFNAHDSQYT